MSASNWTITNVLNPNPDPFGHDNPNGPWVSYWMGISDGHDDKLVYWTRKPDSEAPTVGTEVYGYYIDTGKLTKKGQPKLKFKQEQAPDFQKAQTPARGNGVSGTLPPQQSAWDTRSVRIERQHSQEMAIRAVGPCESDDFRGYKETIKDWTDHFCEDLDAYEKARGLKSSGAGGHVPAAVPPEEVTEDEAKAALTGSATSVTSVDYDPEDDIPF